MKIAGKRTGPSEIEALLAATELVVESAAVGVPEPVKGQAVVCVVTLKRGVPADDATRATLVKAIVHGLGPPFKPLAVLFVDDLPKTRSMKVMRRVVRAACMGQDAGDLSSLVNPEAAESLRRIVATMDIL